MSIERRLLIGLLCLLGKLAFAHGSEALPDDMCLTPTPASAHGLSGGTRRVAALDLVHADPRLVVTARAEARTMVETRRGTGRIITGSRTVHDINAFISGQVRQLHVRPGMRVRGGDIVALIDSPEFVRTQKAYLALLQNQEKLEILREEGRLPNYMKDARENLRWWGMSDRAITRLEQNGQTLESIEIRSPIDGVVTEVLATPGELINAGDRTMARYVVMGRAIARVIAERQPLWLEGFLFPSQLQGIDALPVQVVIHKGDGTTLVRPLHSAAATLDERQLARVMATLGSDSGLYAGAPVEFELVLEHTRSVWVPREALMNQGMDTAVFIPHNAGVFERRTVKPLKSVGDWVAINELSNGTPVVVQGKMALEGAYRLSASGHSAAHADHHH